MRSIHGLFMLAAVALFSGCAAKPDPKTPPAPITLTKPDINTQRVCFVSGSTMTCISRVNLPNGGKRMTVETIPLAKPE